LLVYTGIRFGEACALRRRSVIVANKALQVAESLSDVNGVLTFEAPKNHQRRSVAVPAFLAELLEKRLADVPDREDALLSPARTARRCGTRTSCAGTGNQRSRLLS
jgi:integrase